MSAIYLAMSKAKIEAPPVGMDFISLWKRSSPRFAKRERGRDEVFFLGDSTVIAYPGGHSIPKRLGERVEKLARGKPKIRVRPVGAMGFGPFDYYLFADEIVRSRPDQIVVPFNLASLAESWDRSPRRELAGWVASDRILELLTLPIHVIGLSADQVLYYGALVRAGAVDPWYRLTVEQARVGRAWRAVTDAVRFTDENPSEIFRMERAYHGASRSILLNSDRFNAASSLYFFGAALGGVATDDPKLRALDGTLRRFRQARIATLVYVVPLNVEHLQRVGVLNESGLAETLASIERVVRENGGRFVDLHALLPDAGFRDAFGHFTADEAIDGPARVAARLAPWVVEQARKPAR